MNKILVVDDERELVELLAFALRRAGYTVLAAHDGPTALKLLASESPELAVLDVNLGEHDGFELLREIRRRSDLPVIMLTGRNSENDKVLGFDLGADDYVTKPFGHRELLARIQANLRRGADPWAPASPAQASLQVGPVTLDSAQHRVTRDGRPIQLTVTEFRLLQLLMTNAGAVVPRTALLRQVWGYHDSSEAGVLRTTIHRLRRKLSQDGEPDLIQTVAGVGFMLPAVHA
jgi:DNA-binding response OmpR family regulator